MQDIRGENAQQRIDTLIGQGCRVEGKLIFQGGLRVDGCIVGDVCAELPGAGYVMVPPQGRIEGDVRAAHIVVSGQITGNLHATGRVELLSRARIIGNVRYGHLSMQAGCSLRGTLCQDDGPNSPEVIVPLAATPGVRGYNSKLLIHKAGAFP